MKVRKVKSKKKGNRVFPNIQPKPRQVPWAWAEVPVEAASSSAGNSQVPMGFPEELPQACRSSLALSHPTSHWECASRVPSSHQGFQWKSQNLQEGSKGWRADPKPEEVQGQGNRSHGRENSSHHLGFPQPPTSPPKLLNTQHLKWNLPKSPPGLCHSPSELKGTKPLRYKLMLKLFVKHLKFSVTYFKYPPCSPEGGSKPNTNWEPMGEKGGIEKGFLILSQL